MEYSAEDQIYALKSAVASLMEVFLETSPQAKPRLLQKLRLMGDVHRQKEQEPAAELLRMLIQDVEGFGQ